MATKNEQPPQVMKMRNHVASKRSKTTGHLEDQSLDIDARTLALLGKRQRLKRVFGRVSLVAFSVTLLASWEGIACSLQEGLINGGPAALVYGLLFSFTGSLATGVSLAELTSMLPTSGGQYHWVAELAPIRFATQLSYFSGWLTVFARLSLAASAAYVAATEIQGLLVFNIESYVSHPWHGTLFYWAVMLVAVLVNILGIRLFPHIETVAFIHHVCFFFVFLIPLVYLSPQSTAKFVFATFENVGGWSSNGISWGIGLRASAWALVGIEGASHMSEEVKNSATVVPQSMVIALLISGALTFGASIALLYSVGDLRTILNTNTNYPIIQMFYTATQSKPATTAIIVGLMFTIVFSTFGQIAAASRLTWALARDEGFPFSHYFEHINKHYLIPVRSILLVAFIAMLLGLINIGSSTAFSAMISLSLIGTYASYVLPISLLAMRRMGNKHLAYGPFQLKKWGLAVNIISIANTVILIIFTALPPNRPVTARNMNYSGVVFGAVVLLSAFTWILHGRRTYKGPVKEIIDDLHLH